VIESRATIGGGARWAKGEWLQGQQERPDASLRAAIGGLLRGLLDRDSVPEEVRFSALGLTSLGGLRLINAMRDTLGIEIDLGWLLHYPTVSALAQACFEYVQKDDGMPVSALPETGSYSLSPIQESLYALHSLAEDSDSPALPWLFEQRGDSPSRLDAETAFRAVLARHEPLRTAYRLLDGRPRQVVLAAGDVQIDFAFSDLTGHPRPLAAMAAIYRDIASRPFDLANGRVARLHLVRQERRWSTLTSAHHIASDSLTARTIAADFAQALAGTELAPFPFQYKDYVHWLDAWCAGPGGSRALGYWRDALSGLRPSCVPRGSFATAFVERRGVLARPAETALAPWLLAAVALALSQWDGRRECTIGLAVSTRDLPGLTEQVGPFVNTLPLRVRPEGLPLPALTATVGRLLERALPHKRLPVERLAAAVPGAGLLFDVGVSIEERPEPGQTETALRNRSPCSEATAVPLLLVIMHDRNQASLRFRYRVDAYSRDEVTDLVAKLVALISEPRATQTEFCEVVASRR
jgi:acyl carrier protein